LFFSGCSQTQPQCEPKIIRVKTKVPKLIIIEQPKPYKITDKTSLDNTYYKINKEQLKMASMTSQKRIKIIDFYEEQITRFNKEFAK